jgi:hypothetical protein
MKKILLSKKAAWLEKSRDMYRVEQKPVGRDRQKVLGPTTREIPYTWTELPKSGLKITAAEILQFDPSKRRLKSPGKPRKPSPALPTPEEPELSDEMQEERDALFYAYDMTAYELRILYNNAVYMGELDLANRVQKAYYALTGETL